MKVEEVKAALVDKAAELARGRQPGEAFLRRYWARVPADDLAGRDPVDLYGAALAHLHLSEGRVPGETRVRVYTPSFDDDGWASTHSVVEIVVDDMPFLVDSVRMELVRQGCGLHLVAHPVMNTQRDGHGRLTGLAPGSGTAGDGVAAEAFLHVEIDRQPDASRREEIRDCLERILGDVRAAVADWPAMRARALELAAELQEKPPAGDADTVSEARDFLRFLADDHFVFLGYRDYDLVVDDEGDQQLRVVAGSGLGILGPTRIDPTRTDPIRTGPIRTGSGGPEVWSASFARVPLDLRHRAAGVPARQGGPDSPGVAANPGGPLLLAKASARATVHRPTALDYVGVLRYRSDGTVVGERRFLGLYTSAVHKAPTATIPVVRRTVAAVIARAGYAPNSHDGKALVEVLETYPRLELLEISADELFAVATGILALEERQRPRLFARRDRFGRYWSCLVFVPLDRYTQAVRARITDILMAAFAGESVEYSARVGESVLARLHFIVRIAPEQRTQAAAPDLEAVEAQLVEATRAWVDDLSAALLEEHGEARGLALLRRYGDAFPSSYRETFPARTAVSDIGRIEGLGGDAREDGPGRPGDVFRNDTIALGLSAPLDEPNGLLRLKLFQARRPVPLSDVLPRLEHMGVRVLDQRPFEVRRRPESGEAVESVWIHDFGLAPETALAPEPNSDLETEVVKETFVDAFAATWRGEAESDGFNRLVLLAGLTWREVAVLRAYAKYLRQAGYPFSQNYMEAALAGHPHVARLLVELFRARFDPDRGQPDPDDEATLLGKRLEEAIDAVASLDEDRILRSFLVMVRATRRTSWFCDKETIAFKLDPTEIPDLPRPRPRYEIFVCSPRVEGVHLRGGRVSRGGVRWSDRREDFRTEILGLMKAQMVKNAVIVPVGAKGGFVMKQPGDEVSACYRLFISGLLDVTDNIVNGETVHPDRVVAHDGDDAYLVVAADKGTATFSDLANSIALEYGFWLGDAFASGGSSGYDHKKMGITARGAWTSVERHFRELGHNVATEPFTAVGIGDMSGDVFGNGMLLSRQIRLVAAFDHRHIFLDPDPGPETSFAERQRLFGIPRSSWADYDSALISAGGGVFPRTAKSIALTPEVRAALDVTAEALPPTELVRAILRAPVDLFWNGGIGTYVKASTETNAEVGDKANDPVRVDATQLRAKVVAEGGNLGFTQRGRIEFALGAGRSEPGKINTDAIDNSAGVDCSDHEVNIKVLLGGVVADGELTTKQRDRLLVEMTGDVAAMVLRDNYDQTAALANATAQAAGMADVHGRYLRKLESEGKLDRTLEFLPTDEVLAQRRANNQGLTAPEFAVVLAYTKINVAAALLASDAPEDPWLSQELAAYFPPALRAAEFATAMANHPLRREIVATGLTNNLIDRAGTSFVYRLTEETGASVPDLARAHAAAIEIFGLRAVWADIEALDHQVVAATQLSMTLIARRLAERATRWFVRHPESCRRGLPAGGGAGGSLDVAATITAFAAPVADLAGVLPDLLGGADRELVDGIAAGFVDSGVPDDLARRVAHLRVAHVTLDVAGVAATAGVPLTEVASAYFALGTRLELDWLRAQIEGLSRDERWQGLARAALRDDYAAERAVLTGEVLAAGGIGEWIEPRRGAVERFFTVLDEIRAGAADLATLSVAMREVRALRS